MIQNFARLFIFLFLSLLFSYCSVKKDFLKGMTEDNLKISYVNKRDSIKNPNFYFESTNKNLISLGFLNKFNDTIGVVINGTKYIEFYRNDTLNYRDMDIKEIFKSLKIKKPKNKKITVYLKEAKRKITFNLVNNRKLYLISHYNDSWYLTVWE